MATQPIHSLHWPVKWPPLNEIKTNDEENFLLFKINRANKRQLFVFWYRPYLISQLSSMSAKEPEDDLLGVRVPLSAEVANQLRLQQEQQEANKKVVDPLDDWEEVLPGIKNIPLTISNDEDDAEDDNKQNEKDQADDEDEEENSKNADEDANAVNDDDDNSSVSSPPPNMPVVLVDLARLVGYVPSTEDEKRELTHQIQTALWHGSAEAADCRQGGNPQESEDINSIIDAAQHFDQRVTELMENGLALHSTIITTTTASQEEKENEEKEQQPGDNDSSSFTFLPENKNDNQEQQQCCYVEVTYPEYLCTNNNKQDESLQPQKVLVTAQIWKHLLKPHNVPVVDSILTHLRQCHRSLVWKYAMHQELKQLAQEEDEAKIRRHQRRALEEWKFAKREVQLDQLYQVRETLEHRLETAQQKVQELEEERDRAVELEIRKRRAMGGGVDGSGGGLEAFDLNSTILAFPDANTWLGLEDEDGDDEDQVGPSFVSSDDDGDYDHLSDESGYDADPGAEDRDSKAQPPAEGTIANEATTTDPTTATAEQREALPKRDGKARREALAKRRRRRLEEATKEAEHASKLDKAKAEEARMREMLTSNDLKLSQAIAAALEQKLESVDNLLDSLQDEAWADEEAQENGKSVVPGGAGDAEDGDESSGDDFSLLDQVLAMILGAFPPPSASNGANQGYVDVMHTQNLQTEHNRIIRAWKAHFGRLPPSLPVDGEKTAEETQSSKPQQAAAAESQQRQSELRSAFGIVENEEDDWDGAESGAEEETSKQVVETRNNRQQQQVHKAESQPPAPAPAQPPRVGLRPGGKAVGLRPGGKAKR